MQKVFFFLAALLTLCSCGKGHSMSKTPADTTPDPALVYSAGWSQLEIVSSGSKITIDGLGHFSTSRNACWVEEFGAASFGEWNAIARGANFAVKNGLTAEPFCSPGSSSQDPWHFDGTAELKLQDGKKITIMESRAGEICTWIKDAALSQEFLAALNKTLVSVAHEGCLSGAP